MITCVNICRPLLSYASHSLHSNDTMFLLIWDLNCSLTALNEEFHISAFIPVYHIFPDKRAHCILNHLNPHGIWLSHLSQGPGSISPFSFQRARVGVGVEGGGNCQPISSAMLC